MNKQIDFCGFDRYQEVSVREIPAEIRHAYDTTMRLRGRMPGPQKIRLAYPALSQTALPVGAYYQT